ncbi:MAG: HIT family protein [Flavobacteriales bacterium]|jgi:histidine triad (HIT) family protein|tara:strand:- start:813 stop:1199 length:387 start_codon:yes stop_codon:yes gene_type:complete
MSSIFSKIIAGDIPCHKIDENEEFLAFLDIMPLAKGHVLVIPKIEVDYIFDIEDDLLSRMMIFAKSVAKKVGSKIECKRIGVAIIGLEVPHAHIHLVPLQSVSDINFEKAKLSLSSEELESIAKKINS